MTSLRIPRGSGGTGSLGGTGGLGGTGSLGGTGASTRAVYVISVAAELAGVHPQTLRIYERKGLLDPVRTHGGIRRYSEADIERLRRIQHLTAAGINLEGARRILALEAELEALAVELARVRSEAQEAVMRTHRLYRRDLVPLAKSRLPTKWRG